MSFWDKFSTRPTGYDRVDRNESDGMVFYGYDNEEKGTTIWYDEDGNLDCETPTPGDDEPDWY